MLAVHYTTISSTNDAAQRIASPNGGESVLVSARMQTRGRGRSGRLWQSPAGGAWFSVAWPTTTRLSSPKSAALDVYAAAPLMVGLVVAQCIDNLLARHDTTIKWPNDLLLHNRKVAGILCETSILPGIAPTLILGVGINANIDAASLGSDLRHPAISLRDVIGRDVDVHCLIDACGCAIADAMHRLETDGLTDDDLHAIEQRLAWRGQPVAMHVGREFVHGILDGIEPDGCLRLSTSRGPACFRSGEVSLLRPILQPSTAPQLSEVHA